MGLFGVAFDGSVVGGSPQISGLTSSFPRSCGHRSHMKLAEWASVEL